MTHFVLDARTAQPHFPGIGRYVSNLARALIPLLVTAEQLTLLCDPACVLSAPAGAPPGSNVRTVTLATSPFSLAQQWVIPQLLRRLHADLYHSPYIAMPYLPGVPALLTVYDLIPLRYPAHSTTRARLFAGGMTRLALHTARQIVAISEFTRNDFITEFKLQPDRVTAIPLAADPAFQPQSPEAIAAIRARYALPETFALYLGSNKPHKNLVRLVEAWSATAGSDISGSDTERKSQTANRKLVIGGAWDERYPEARQRGEVLELGKSVVWLGAVPENDLPALYAAASVFVFPSLYEGFGLPVLEAMACGTPVICSNTSSLPEVAENAALLVDPADTATLAEALHRVLSNDDLRAMLRSRGLEQAAQFSWERTAAATLALYRQISPVRRSQDSLLRASA